MWWWLSISLLLLKSSPFFSLITSSLTASLQSSQVLLFILAILPSLCVLGKVKSPRLYRKKTLPICLFWIIIIISWNDAIYFGSIMLWATLLMLRCCVLWCFVLWKGSICCVVFWCQLHGAYKVWLWWCFDSQVGLLLREKSVEQHLEDGFIAQCRQHHHHQPGRDERFRNKVARLGMDQNPFQLWGVLVQLELRYCGNGISL